MEVIRRARVAAPDVEQVDEWLLYSDIVAAAMCLPANFDTSDFRYERAVSVPPS